MKKDEVSKKTTIRGKIRFWTGKKENRLKLKTRIFFTTVFFAVLFYAGASFSLTREFLFTPENIYDIIFLLIVTFGAINDALINGEFDESQDNEDLQNNAKETKEEVEGIDSTLHFTKQLKAYNKELWHEASFQERERRIDELENKIADRLEKDKEYKDLQDKIDKLKKKDENGNYYIKVNPKNFRKYKKEDFLTLDTNENHEEIDINYKSRKKVRKRMAIFSLARIIIFITLRIGLFAETGSFFDFFIMLFLSVSSVLGAYVFTYDQIREDMSTNELYAREQKLQKLKYIKNIKVDEYA